MDFARKHLEKYGWKEGQGLGKNETGISTAIKPKLKFDNAGIGHNPSDEFKNNWWDAIYNQAACNINVVVDKTDVKVNLNSNESVEISTKGYLKSLKHQNRNLEYGSFIKRSTLTDKGLVSTSSAGDVSEDFQKIGAKILSDEELFAACGGRTAHKGARHGLRQSGKLSRLEKQEKMLLKKLKKVSIEDNDNGNKKNLEKKLKKISDQKDRNISETLTCNPEQMPVDKNFLLSSPVKSNKNRKKQRKRVSFNETVTEYQTQDLDSSPQSAESESSTSYATSTLAIPVKLQDEKDDNTLSEKDPDEGIDCPDLDPKNSDSNSNSDEFDTPVYKELSKKERKILRRKLKKQNERNSKTALFLNGVLDKMSDAESEEVQQLDGKCQKCSKRKLKFEPDDNDEFDAKKSHYDYQRSDKKKTKSVKKKKSKKEKLEKRLNRVVSSFNSCKISDSE